MYGLAVLGKHVYFPLDTGDRYISPSQPSLVFESSHQWIRSLLRMIVCSGFSWSSAMLLQSQKFMPVPSRYVSLSFRLLWIFSFLSSTLFCFQETCNYYLLSFIHQNHFLMNILKIKITRFRRNNTSVFIIPLTLFLWSDTSLPIIFLSWKSNAFYNMKKNRNILYVD